MSKAYKCDICNNFYDENSVCSDGYINPRLVKSNTNYIQLRSRIACLIGYGSGDKIDVCPNCTAKLQKTVDDIIRAEIRKSGVVDGAVGGVEINYTKS